MKRFCAMLCVLLAAFDATMAAAQQLMPSSPQPYIMQPGGLSGQQQGMQKDILKNAPAYPAPDPTTIPPPPESVSVRQAAIECAVAQKVEQMGREGQFPSNMIDAVFEAGQCSGKVQTFMLVAQTEYPNCFPKISLEEGISIFVNWAAAHNDAASENYVAGMTEAFAQTVPCLKR
jgi:hypothetical protein